MCGIFNPFNADKDLDHYGSRWKESALRLRDAAWSGYGSKRIERVHQKPELPVPINAYCASGGTQLRISIEISGRTA